jgi:hypothetical protein
MSEETPKKAQPQIHIGYVNKFEFSETKMKDLLYPHPEKGRIYQIIQRQLPSGLDVYELYIGRENNNAQMDTIFLGSELVGDYGEDKWSHDISIITKSNYLDYEFEGDDLEKLNMWIKTKHSGLKKLMKMKPKAHTIKEGKVVDNNGSTPVQAAPLIAAVEDLKRKIHDMETDLHEIVHGIELIRTKDAGMLRPVARVLSELGAMSEAFSTRPDIVKASIMDSSSHEVTTILALANIQNYIVSEGENTEHLVKAIINLLIELQRVDYQSSTPPTDSNDPHTYNED